MKYLSLLVILLGFACSVKGAPLQYGVPIDFPETQQAPTVNHALDDAQRAGMSLVKVRVDWPRIQPDAKTWNFTSLDALVTKARARDLTVVLVFGPAPSWTVSYLKRPTPEQLTRACPDLKPYVRFATEVAKRYADRVRYYQLWERPTAASLLATAAQTRKLFRAAARAVHGVNPALRVIAPEPGDVELGWIYDYLREAQGAEQPDILLLSAVSERATPEALMRRFSVLRDRVLPAPAPMLWGGISVTVEQEWGWTAAAALLLQNVSTLLLQPTAPYRDLCAKPAFFSELQTLATLRGQNYLGWQRVGPATAGVFEKGKQQSAVILPDASPAAGAALRLVQSVEPVEDGIAVPTRRVEVRRLTGGTQQIEVSDDAQFPLPPQPIILAGVSLAPTAGALPLRASPMTCESVSLDRSGADPRAIRPLRNLPGGRYAQVVIQGQIEVLQTIRDQQPWIHLDVPDDFLFFNLERRPVEVSVRVRGVTKAQKTGLSLYYDAIGGMNNSAWQWIDIGPYKEFTYTFRLNDALFAGSEGYDLRLDMGGSEENLRVIDVTVWKLAR